jgi:hypothetical protein
MIEKNPLTHDEYATGWPNTSWFDDIPTPFSYFLYNEPRIQRTMIRNAPLGGPALTVPLSAALVRVSRQSRLNWPKLIKFKCFQAIHNNHSIIYQVSRAQYDYDLATGLPITGHQTMQLTYRNVLLKTESVVPWGWQEVGLLQSLVWMV